MTPQFQKLREEASQLSSQERLALANELFESTDGSFAEDLADDQRVYSEELAAEVQRRESELDSGLEKSIPHEEAMRRMFGKRDG